MRRMPYILITALVLSLGSSALPAPLPPEPPEPAAQKEVRDQALRLVRGGRIAEARDLHLSLWRVGQRPTDAFNVGMLSQRLRDFPTAAEFLTLWLDLVGPPGASLGQARSVEELKKKYEQARVDLQEARKHVAALQVNVSDPGAEVSVDERRIGVSPLKHPVFVWPGQRRVRAQLGGAQVEEVVFAAADGQHTVRLVLPATSAIHTPRAGGTRGAPRSDSTLPQSAPSPHQGIVVALAATSVVLGILGGVAVGMANDAADDREQTASRARYLLVHDCPGSSLCDDFTAADGRAKTMTGLAIGAFLGAGAAAAGATTLYLLSTPSAQVRVRATTSAVQLAVTW
jgi:hypothetical protein